MKNYKLDLDKYKKLARKVAAEGCVLLKNDKNSLPLKKGEKVSVFGRSMFNYYKAGLGSGGLVNTNYTVSILDALKDSDEITLNEDLLNVYANWIKENPFDEGEGWGKVPWAQVEMPVTAELVKTAADNSDKAIVIIGRTAGEDQDAKDAAGSFRLTDIELNLLKEVTDKFNNVIVLLNVGNIIDMSWDTEYNPDSVLYVWQGGQEGGNGVADILLGKESPSGKLTDTIAKHVDDYPSTANFFDNKQNIYVEDIYVGYRYFETFAKDKVLYPFGFGLSYTSFSINSQLVSEDEENVYLNIFVENLGSTSGKEVVQTYVKAPQGVLGKPARVLVDFFKTEELRPGEEKDYKVSIPKKYLASYDDGGFTGHKSCFLLEAGEYEFYVGSDVRSAKLIGSYNQSLKIIEELQEAYAPVIDYKRIKPKANGEGFEIDYEEAPKRTVNLNKRVEDDTPIVKDFTGDMGFKFEDVFEKKVSLDDFVAQLTESEMAELVRGEGMCSPKVTPGVAAAFGGVTDNLQKYGIPVACCADGPSGIRMDCGTKAFSIPNGTAIGCTFNAPLTKKLFVEFGHELRMNKIDTILGPGINIHRNPLNGRNFEYITEDPFLNGKIAAAQLKGMESSNVTGTLKHYVANNQESARRHADSVISERALREIYLKGFEMGVREGGAYSIMTTYGSVNGLWTAGSYDLNTQILRKEWGFDGIVMTDWWAEANFEGEKSSLQNTAAMVKAQNDLFMVVQDSASNSGNDNTMEMIESGYLKRGHLVQSSKNILNFILGSLTMEHTMGMVSQEELDNIKSGTDSEFDLTALEYIKSDGDKLVIDASNFNTSKGSSEYVGVIFEKFGEIDVTFKYKSDLGVLAQNAVSIFMDNTLKTTVSVQGTEGVTKEVTQKFDTVFGPNHYIKFYFAQSGLKIETITFTLKKEINPFATN